MATGPTQSAPGDGAGSGDRQRIEQAVRNLRAGIQVEDSFDFLFRRFSAPLTRQLISWGASAEEGRDLNQETFQRIFQDVEAFQGGDRLFESWVGWIWKIARTTWLRNERYKRARKRPQNPQPLEEIDEVRERTARPPRQLDRLLDQEVRQRVRRAIDELPEKELKCVLLYYYQGLKTQEIAVILRIAQGTVKAHLSHARAKLKAKLGSLFELDDEHQTDLRPREQRV